MPIGQPNILAIWGDDIGIANRSCCSDGLMGSRTPNIDRVASEGIRCTDAHGERAGGTLLIWAEPSAPPRVPMLSNRRTDPFERADTTSNTYDGSFLSKADMIATGLVLAGRFLATFEEFPPRQKAASFSIDRAAEELERALASA